MKIFLVGSGKAYAIENFYTSYMQEAGAEVLHFPALKIFSDYYYKSLYNKLLFRLGLSSIYKKINHLFKEETNKFQPDVIWVFKGMEIFASSLEWAKEKKYKLVNYNPDNPFIFSGIGSGNKNITESISLYDMHFAYSLTVKKQIENDYQIPSCFLPFGFDLSDQFYEICCKETEISKTCFLGNPDKQRADFLKGLADRGIQLDLYGAGWDKFIRHPNIKTFPSVVYGIDLWKILRRYRVQLNLMRVHNLDSHNMRSFEVPAIGGIMLAPDTKEHRIFFENGKEVFLFSDIENCCGQINRLLSLDGASIDKIRQNARNRSLNSGYSYKHRANYALAEIKRLHETPASEKSRVRFSGTP